MGYTNSGLVVYKKLSPNHSGQRTHSIDRITPHCVVGQCTAEGLGDWFAKSSTQASSNYGIDKDGRVGLYVEEKNRSWCSSSNANDQRAITIECASDTTEPYAFRDAVYKKLITLCVDICKRNGKKKLLWLGDKDKTLNYSPKSDEMVLTVHRWFANKSCPGNWMYARMGDLASKVTAQLGDSSSGSGSTSGSSGSAGGTNTKFPAVPFLVTVIIDDLNIRTSGSMSGKVVGQTGKGVFTIVEVKNGWGRLKSGAGWIYLENASYCTIGKAASESDKKVSPQEEKEEVKEEKVTGLQASTLKALSDADVIKKVGALFTADQKKNGILASVSLAQFILESGYGKSELAQNANNCFGMKKSLSGNTWSGSTWDGKSVYNKQTKEQNADGSYVTITADFRKYACVEDSIADHSAYLLGAMNGSKQRYAGLKGCTDYKKAAQIIKDGGYATSLTYVNKLCDIIQRWDLTQYDVKAAATQPAGSGASADKVIAVAAAEIGYKEKKSNSSLDDKTANAGTANYTKYARDFDQKYPNWYNGKKNGYAWCDMFVDWCFLTAFGYEKALSLLCQPEKSAGAGCTYSLRYFKNKGQLYTSNPKPGDQIFFGTSQNDVSHTGIVEKVDGSKVYTIEGNTSDQVARRSYALNSSRIVGYGRPAYDSQGSGAETPAATATKYYRVRKSWEDKASQIGAYTVLQNAILAVDANPGYAAFDDDGKQVYPEAAFSPYLVRITISDLNYRKGPSTSYKSWGYIEPGIYTIVDEQDGWGLLKAYADKRNGWIKLSYTERV